LIRIRIDGSTWYEVTSAGLIQRTSRVSSLAGGRVGEASLGDGGGEHPADGCFVQGLVVAAEAALEQQGAGGIQRRSWWSQAATRGMARRGSDAVDDGGEDVSEIGADQQ
jgi:hypothetical protein